MRRWTSRRHPLFLLATLLCLALGLCGAVPTQAQVPDAGLGDSQRAEAELREARSELEEIAGRFLDSEAPPLPGPLGLGLSPDEQAFDFRLRREPPEEWSALQRLRLQRLLDRHGAALAGLAARGERVDTDGLISRAAELLRGAVLQSLQDRLALLHGDETACLAGLEVRSRLAERLYLQGGIVGPLLANAVQLLVLEDVHRLTERAATPPAALERLEGLLLDWQLDLPGPAAVFARDSLERLDRMEASTRQEELGAQGPAAARFLAPVAGDSADLARLCRDEGCRRGMEILAARRKNGDRYRVIADLALPNQLSVLERLDGLAELTRVARIALGLRIEAPDLGGYAEDTRLLSAPLQAALADLDGLAYEPHGPAGARLSLDLDRASAIWSGPAAKQVPLLSTWHLPPLASPTGDS